MPLTTTQTQVMASHLAALRHALKPGGPPAEAANFSPNDVLSSMVLELGPGVIPLICDHIQQNPTDATQVDAATRGRICDTCDACITELDNCIGAEIPPGRIFQDLIAKLLKELWPILIKIFFDFFQEGKITQRKPYKI